MAQVVNWSNVRSYGLTFKPGNEAGSDMESQLNAILETNEIEGQKILIEDIQFTTLAVFILYREIPGPPFHDS